MKGQILLEKWKNTNGERPDSENLSMWKAILLQRFSFVLTLRLPQILIRNENQWKKICNLPENGAFISSRAHFTAISSLTRLVFFLQHPHHLFYIISIPFLSLHLIEFPILAIFILVHTLEEKRNFTESSFPFKVSSKSLWWGGFAPRTNKCLSEKVLLIKSTFSWIVVKSTIGSSRRGRESGETLFKECLFIIVLTYFCILPKTDRQINVVRTPRRKIYRCITKINKIKIYRKTHFCISLLRRRVFP